MPTPFERAVLDGLEEILESVAARNHPVWRLYELRLPVLPGGDQVAVEAQGVAEIKQDPTMNLLGRRASVGADGVMVVCGGGAAALRVCAVLRNGLELHRGDEEPLLAPTLRRYLGLASLAIHDESVDVARSFTAGVVVRLARRGAELGGGKLAARFVAKFATELVTGDAWHQSLAGGLGGARWASTVIEDELGGWVDEDLATALLATRGVDPNTALDEIARLAGEDAARLAGRLLFS